ncbi:AbrB/MazE/SpoVT family DNA-binding domain-containing protein [Sulfoacidibacillus ferrooxidans]|uniref:SpoVT-AbrB domain-containing protein n=1 Tax=Sulfoacidibacillus ferrooxidans TaxID=2005001 RepID=A0A9X1VBX1_9BACL|nr:AbrB/MazE/SpoVT family DNA-binding domain-containing protein [Sulfoacidibacillus ferrooxidans]MCI0184922.1 hypothetical protein [Sulfoacidibacillus ferrooxidans]
MGKISVKQGHSGSRQRVSKKIFTTHVDNRGRVLLPQAIRDLLNIQSGDLFYLKPEQNGVHIVKGINPFDALAEDAIRQNRSGQTIALEEILEREGITVDVE